MPQKSFVNTTFHSSTHYFYSLIIRDILFFSFSLQNTLNFPSDMFLASTNKETTSPDKRFISIGSNVSSTSTDINTRLPKAWAAIDRLSVRWKLDPTDKMKRSFYQAVAVSILLCGCTTWTLTKCMDKKLDGNYTRMLPAILKNSKRQHPTKQVLYDHLPLITKTIQFRRIRHARRC